MSDRSNHADTIIRNHVLLSMGSGFIPIPIADVFAVSAIQLDMIRQLCRVYDIDFAENRGKAIVSSLTTSSLARIGAGSLVKLIPIGGTLIGGVTVSVFAGASTYAVGEVFKRHFEMGGTILDFDSARLNKMYKEMFEKGKKVAKEWKEEAESNTEEPLTQEPEVTQKNNNQNVVERLKELAQLKEQGIISQEEFDQMKKKLIDDF